MKPAAIARKSLLSLRGVFPSKHVSCKVFILRVTFMPPFRPAYFCLMESEAVLSLGSFTPSKSILFTSCHGYGAINCTVGQKRGRRQGLYSQGVYRQAVKRRLILYLNYFNPMIFTGEGFLTCFV